MKTSYKYIFVAVIMLNAQYLHGQINLVSNPSLEDYSDCPYLMGQINFAINWFSPLYPSSTSEYYNSCDLTNYVSVPLNVRGYQNSHTGNAYGGIGLYTSNFPDHREYIEGTLIQPLIAGKVYCVEFFVDREAAQFAIDAIGIYFSKDSLLTSTQALITYPSQINNPTNNIITDTANWVKISGSFTASGGEQYITIGNFKDDANTNTQYMGGPLPGYAYYFIDDVSVYECDAPVYTAEAGNTQTVCIGTNDSVQIGSTPQSEYIYWWLPATGLSDDSLANPKARPAVTTTYYLHQKDFKFDETVDSVTVVVKADCDTEDDIFIPNIFSPNNDGKNDILFVRSNNIKTMTFSIYNRWGEMVFESNDINTGWDGRYKKGECNTGVYVYYLTATLMDDSKVEKKGDVALVR